MLKLEDIRWEVGFFKNLYQQIFEDHRAFLSQLDMSGGLKQPLILLSLIALLSAVLSALFTPGIGLLSIPYIVVVFLVAVIVWSGILHLLRGFLAALGEFSSYVRFSAWYCLLTLPVMVLATILPGVGQLINVLLLGVWFYGFLRVFQASTKKLAIVAVAFALLWILPLIAMKSLNSFTESAMSTAMKSMPEGPQKQHLAKMMKAVKEGDVKAIEKFQRELSEPMEQLKKEAQRRPRNDKKKKEDTSRCGVALSQLRVAVEQAEGRSGSSARQETLDQLKGQLTQQLTSYQDWVKSAGGEAKLRQHARNHPTQAKQYLDGLDQMKCLEKNLRELSSL